jgi:predicted secreted protein
MKITSTVLIMWLMMIGAVAAQNKDTTLADEKINAKAIWAPGMEMMHAIHDSCDGMKYPSFGECFLNQIKKLGASPEAIEFTKLTGNEGFMRDFKETGSVDIAYSVYPFRANENQVCFLVNGSPKMIDIDGYEYISKVSLKSNAIYKQIAKSYPNVSIWPGDRSGTDYPAIRNLPDGGQQFIFTYRLQDGCHACKLIGYAFLGFDYDKNAKFSGIQIINILELKKSGKELKVKNENSQTGKLIKVKSGNCFTIALNLNATTGYTWEFEQPLNEKLISYAGKVYLPPEDALPGAGGKELWNFVADKSGSMEISFKYTRPWEKGIKPASKKTFKIIVK